jgi:hypothetical protein
VLNKIQLGLGIDIELMNDKDREEKLLDIQNFLEDVAKSVKDGKPDSLLAYIGRKIGNRLHKKVGLLMD